MMITTTLLFTTIETNIISKIWIQAEFLYRFAYVPETGFSTTLMIFSGAQFTIGFDMING